MIPIINDQFSCHRCGSCCTNLKRAFSENSDREQRLIFRLAEEKDTGLPLWEWEAERLQELAAEKNLNARVEPLHFFYDKSSKRAVIVSFHLNHDSCIFYGPGECTIYHKRPFVCAMFPVIKSSVFDFIFEKKEIKREKTLCPNDKGHEFIKGNMTASEYAEKMQHYYGDSFEMSVQNDLVNYFIVKKIRMMADEKIIDPIISPAELAVRRFENSEKINFFDFLAEHGEDKEGIIERFVSLFQARKMIDSIVMG